MARTAKREQASISGRSERVGVDNDDQDFRAVKREKVAARNRADADDHDADSPNSTQQGTNARRVIRSRYLAVKNLINDERDDMSNVDSDKFKSIISEVETLHHLVQKPREQVADAEALLDIANTLVTSVKSQSNDGFSPSDFVTRLLRDFGQTRDIAENAQIKWQDVGISVSHIFSKVQGCCTMLGPMNTELKQRKVGAHRQRSRPTESERPKELNDPKEEARTDTDKNMATMFEVLRKKKRVKLENLMLNRSSFAQTVENLFTLSFLVKDGRAEIVIDENGSHFVSPKNAPAANLVRSGDVSYDHFVFRFDFKDWKLMKDLVPAGEEVMPHRKRSDDMASSQADPEEEWHAPYTTTPIKKFSRNRGRIVQEESVVEDSPEIDDAAAAGAAAIRKCKRKLNCDKF